jgi:hypothetical protein
MIEVERGKISFFMHLSFKIPYEIDRCQPYFAFTCPLVGLEEMGSEA